MMNRHRLRMAVVAAIGAAALIPLAAQAHRAWMLPSSTSVSGNNAWVTVDAAVSNDLFYFDHQPGRLDSLKVYAPDGTEVEAKNKATGRYRSTFDVQLDKPGTYRISQGSDNTQATYEVNGETKNTRGTLDAVRKEIPAGAKVLGVSRQQSRMDVFVTQGKPTDTVVKPTGNGLELVAYTHPNDLVAGDPANFGLSINGKPAAGVTVTVIPGGIRYRDEVGEIKVVTDKAGKFSVNWPTAGMYWMNASYPPRVEDDHEDEAPPAARAPGAGPNAGGAAAAQRTPAAGQPAGAPNAAGTGGGPGGPGGRPMRPVTGGTIDAPTIRASYTATLEVMAP